MSNKKTRVKTYIRNGKRVRSFFRKNRKKKIIAAATVLGVSGLYLNRKNINQLVGKASLVAYSKSNSSQFNNLIDSINKNPNIPTNLKNNINNMTGAGKVFLAQNILRQRNFKLIRVDSKNNFSTWQSGNSTMSVGSVGSRVITFSTDKKGNTARGFSVYDFNFKINESYSRGNSTRAEGLQIIKSVKSMFDSHLEMVPNDSLLVTEAFDKDSLAKKRSSIYSRVGFRSIPGTKGGSKKIYAVKSGGKVISPPDSLLDTLKNDINKGSIKYFYKPNLLKFKNL